MALGSQNSNLCDFVVLTCVDQFSSKWIIECTLSREHQKEFPYVVGKIRVSGVIKGCFLDVCQVLPGYL